MEVRRSDFGKDRTLDCHIYISEIMSTGGLWRQMAFLANSSKKADTILTIRNLVSGNSILHNKY